MPLPGLRRSEFQIPIELPGVPHHESVAECAVAPCEEIRRRVSASSCLTAAPPSQAELHHFWNRWRTPPGPPIPRRPRRVFTRRRSAVRHCAGANGSFRRHSRPMIIVDGVPPRCRSRPILACLRKFFFNYPYSPARGRIPSTPGTGLPS